MRGAGVGVGPMTGCSRETPRFPGGNCVFPAPLSTPGMGRREGEREWLCRVPGSAGSRPQSKGQGTKEGVPGWWWWGKRKKGRPPPPAYAATLTYANGKAVRLCTRKRRPNSPKLRGRSERATPGASSDVCAPARRTADGLPGAAGRVCGTPPSAHAQPSPCTTPAPPSLLWAGTALRTSPGLFHPRKRPAFWVLCSYPEPERRQGRRRQTGGRVRLAPPQPPSPSAPPSLNVAAGKKMVQ